MTYIFKIIFASFIAVFSENIIFSRAMGLSSLIRISRSRDNLFGFGICVTYFTAAASAAGYLTSRLTETMINRSLYLPLICVSEVGIIYIVTLLVLWRLSGGRFARARKYVHISAFNSAVLGAIFLNDKYCSTFPEYIFGGLSIAVGFVLAIYLVSIVYDRLYSEDVPYCFRGYPLLLIYIGIMSMAFYGLSGYGVKI